MVAEQTGAVVRVIPISDAGELDMDAYLEMLGPKTRIVSVTHVSNALGTITPVKEIIDAAHDAGAVVMLDGAQAAPHLAIDVQALDSDFYTFSGHKVFGPTGIGVLHGKRALLEEMDAYQGGGDMILTVSFDGTTFNDLPYKFEAGTPNIAGAIGLGAALEYLMNLGIDGVDAHEHALLEAAMAKVAEVPGVQIIGTAREKSSIVSFVMEGVHAHDLGTIVDSEGVAIRTGHHCAMPLMKRYGVAATARASFALYNTLEEVDALVAALWKAKEVFDR
jgi:cysteine desulfurase/selenocysteine lyase